MIQSLCRSATPSTQVAFLYRSSPSTFACQKRTFFDSILKSSLGSGPLRSLTHTKVIPYSSNATFKAVADVSGYPTFLPFTISSHIISRDGNGYPTRAQLKIGYEKFGIEEKWDSIVNCEPDRGLIETSSGEQGGGALFEVLKAKWQIMDAGEKQTKVKLDVDIKFRNAVYDQLFAQVEGRVASSMMSAFEKKIQDIEGSR